METFIEIDQLKQSLEESGFAFLRNVFSAKEVEQILKSVPSMKNSDPNVLGADAPYAMRKVLAHTPELKKLVWNQQLRDTVFAIVGKAAFITKSIWFDKPPGSNWFVGYHQDISISVDRRSDIAGYSRWTQKNGTIGVVPPVRILERTLTIRIHLDDADGFNGALKVLSGSHRNGIMRNTATDSNEVLCPMKAGDAMLMRPLLFHASSRSINDKPRRVLHIEVNGQPLSAPLKWSEKQVI